MPIANNQSGGRTYTNLQYVGTQYVDNGASLSFAGATTIALNGTLFSTPGDYVLFDYTAGSFAGGQSELNSNVTVDSSGLVSTQFVALRDDPVAEVVILTLKNSATYATDGVQYVEGNLSFDTGFTLFLDPNIYTGVGDYVLFDVSGTVSGLTNVLVVPPAGFAAAPLTTTTGGLGTRVILTLTY